VGLRENVKSLINGEGCGKCSHKEKCGFLIIDLPSMKQVLAIEP
jgi:hypothetical protein